MKNVIFCVGSFALGALAGFFGAKVVYGKKEEQEVIPVPVKEETENMDEETSKKEHNRIFGTYEYDAEPEVDVLNEEPPKEEGEYEKMIIEEDYGKKEPYEIDGMDDFGEKEGYETDTLYWYSNGYLADADGHIIRDVDGTVGMNNMNALEESYDDDPTMYIRNDELETDYEVMYVNEPFEKKGRR